MKVSDSACFVADRFAESERSCNFMKSIIRYTLLAVIICSAVVSVAYAAELYRTKYAPRYLGSNR